MSTFICGNCKHFVGGRKPCEYGGLLVSKPNKCDLWESEYEKCEIIENTPEYEKYDIKVEETMAKEEPIYKLFECPFCNSNDVNLWDKETDDPTIVFWWARCGECHARGPLTVSKNQAQDLWNGKCLK